MQKSICRKMRATPPIRVSSVAHLWDMPTGAGNVCFQGYFGSPVLGRRAGLTPSRKSHEPQYICAFSLVLLPSFRLNISSGWGKAMKQRQPNESAAARRLWTPAEVERLRDMLDAGKTVLEISRKLKRTIQAVYARLQRISRRRPRPSK
jgi:hypothetical protein